MTAIWVNGTGSRRWRDRRKQAEHEQTSNATVRCRAMWGGAQTSGGGRKRHCRKIIRWKMASKKAMKSVRSI